MAEKKPKGFITNSEHNGYAFHIYGLMDYKLDL